MQLKICKGFEVFQKKAYKWSMSPEKVLNIIIIKEFQMGITWDTTSFWLINAKMKMTKTSVDKDIEWLEPY